MLNWFKRRSRLERLKVRYRNLMRESYKLALRDPKKCDRIHSEAERIYKEIQYLIS